MFLANGVFQKQRLKIAEKKKEERRTSCKTELNAP